jgi:uncharacterized protein (TIGR03663 family)
VGPGVRGDAWGNGRADGRVGHDGSAAGSPNTTTPVTAAAGFRLRVTLEGAIWLALVVLAALSRFWDLGSRALHHDETLHAYYSWLLATGQGYTHDPLMHGPFLFHANALLYALFGASDAMSRVWMAVCGTILVGLPWFLRGPRQLGRWGALTAGVLLLVSPALLYQSRYIRHDTFTVVGATVLLIAIARYVERPQRRWLVTAGAALGVLFTNHEIVFGLVVFFLAPIAIALLWGRLRPAVPALAAGGVVALLLVSQLPDRFPLPKIPWNNPTRAQQLDFYQALLVNPLPWALLLLGIATVGGVGLLVRRHRVHGSEGEGWVASLLGGAEPGSVTYAVNAAWADKTGLGVAAAVFAAIVAVFFTTMFTNLYGLVTATFATDGTLLYWLGQHEEQRGEQPWFYYLLLFPQYEPIAAVVGTLAALAVGWRALLVALGRRAPGPRFFFHGTLAIWFAAIFFALSWAGEKMPWLVIHITLPATLLAAAALGAVAERWQAAAAGGRVRTQFPWWAFWALLAAAAAWFLLAGRLSFGAFVPAAGGWARTVTPEALRWWWLLAVPPLVALAVLAATVLRGGPKRAGMTALAAGSVLLMLLQIHLGWRLAYLEGDVPKDMLVYTQTSPDVHRMTAELTTLSRELTGGNDLEIRYDTGRGTDWPMQWYLRDFPNARIYGGSSLAAPPDAPILLVSQDNADNVTAWMDGYSAQEYVLRWWFPEYETYRYFALAPELDPGASAWRTAEQPHGPLDVLRSVGSSFAQVLTPEGQQRVYRLLMYRDLPAPIGTYDYTLYVRNDLVPAFNSIRYE